jgi:hypothetical protein
MVFTLLQLGIDYLKRRLKDKNYIVLGVEFFLLVVCCLCFKSCCITF